MAKKTFQNLTHTPQFGEGYGVKDALKMLFNKPKMITPPGELPFVKTDLKKYHTEKPSIIWFGHSSYLIHANGLNILVDPVFSGHASPFSFMLRAFKGADFYKPEDMPKIDCMILTHNHYDHLDYKTIKKLAGQTKAYIMPLYVSDSLRGININKDAIKELDWWQSADLADGVRITATPARHFSGRSLRRNGSLWASYVLETGRYRIFIGGDSGYDAHFKEIGKRFGPFDLALLECGQYNVMWPYIHSTPEELIPESKDLNAKVVMPIHWGKFALSSHAWDDPIKRFVAAADEAGIAYTTPRIGEPVILDEYYLRSGWWVDDKLS